MHTHASRALWVVPASRILPAPVQPAHPPALDLHGHRVPGLLHCALILLTIVILIAGLLVGLCDHLIDLMLSWVVR